MMASPSRRSTRSSMRGARGLLAVAVMGWSFAGRSDEPPKTYDPNMTRPRPAEKIDWSYPEHLRNRDVSDTLVIKCTIPEDGRVQNCEAVRPVPGFTEWAIEKLEHSRYVPATLNGRPVRVTYVFSIHIASPGRDHPPSGQPSPRVWRPLIDVETARICRGSGAEKCLAAALVLLEADGGTVDPDRPGRVLGAACEGGAKTACDHLDQWYTPAQLIDAIPTPRASPAGPMHPNQWPPGSKSEVICWISDAGLAHDCRSGNSELDHWLVDQMTMVHFVPARFKGRPFETEHLVRYTVRTR
jgi:Gram-negative bacterial TonB protein C-terminal